MIEQEGMIALLRYALGKSEQPVDVSIRFGPAQPAGSKYGSAVVLLGEHASTQEGITNEYDGKVANKVLWSLAGIKFPTASGLKADEIERTWQGNKAVYNAAAHALTTQDGSALYALLDTERIIVAPAPAPPAPQVVQSLAEMNSTAAPVAAVPTHIEQSTAVGPVEVITSVKWNKHNANGTVQLRCYDQTNCNGKPVAQHAMFVLSTDVITEAGGRRFSPASRQGWENTGPGNVKCDKPDAGVLQSIREDALRIAKARGMYVKNDQHAEVLPIMDLMTEQDREHLCNRLTQAGLYVRKPAAQGSYQPQGGLEFDL
jgi:hypothetical protein